MIHIKYKLNTSPLHGVGLFADEPIKKDEVIYTASPVLDVNITQEQFNALDEKEKQEVRWWGFLDPTTNMWHVDFDVSHFINHADQATVTQDASHTDAYLVAARDIEKGEELTQDYLEFESREDLRARGIVSKKAV
jgi:SET domain-containing protein